MTLEFQKRYVVICVLFAATLPLNAADPSVANLGRRHDVARTVIPLLRDGKLEQAFNSLEPVVDAAVLTFLDDEDGLSSVCAGLHRRLSQLSSEAQFDLLSKWSIPESSPPTVRVLTTLVPTLSPPAEFARALGERPRDTSFPVSSIGEVRGVFSTSWSLVVAARDSGRLKRLMTELGPLVEKKIPNADLLMMLALIEEGRPDLSKLAEPLSRRVEQVNGVLAPAGVNPKSIDPANLVLALAALQDLTLRPLGEQMLAALLAATEGQPACHVRPFLRQAYATAILMRHENVGEADIASKLAPKLKCWVPVSGGLERVDRLLGNGAESGSPRQDSRSTTDVISTLGSEDTQPVGSTFFAQSKSVSSTDAVWLVHDDHLLHLSGSGHDALILRYPLNGEFEFQCETQIGGRVETNGELIYSGLGFQALGTELRMTGSDGIVLGQRPCPFVHSRSSPSFVRLSIASISGSTTTSVNLHPIWTDKTGCQASPWLGLSSIDESRPLFRNIKLTGQPVIARSVRMIDGHVLRGWQPEVFGDRFDTEVASRREWQLVDGVLNSAINPPTTATVHQEQTLFYQRPLLDGESVSYDFFYKPGECDVSPSLGRVAFLLQPQGVRIRWLTVGPWDWTGLTDDNTVIEPLNRRGPRPLPLRANEWNRVTMARTKKTVTLSIDDIVVYQRPIDWAGDHRFGLVRNDSTLDVKVRNVVLTGDWPQTLPQEFLDNPLSTVDERVSVAEGHALNRLFQEEFLSENVFAVRRKAFTMPVAERFEFLSRWVLPGSDHPGFRVSGEFTQTQPAKVAYEPAVEHPESGAQLVSPVFDWLDAARELGRLSGCLTSVETAVPPDTEFQRRARISLLLLLNMELGNQHAASECVEEFYELLRPQTSTDLWPEMLVIDRSVRRFATNDVVAKFMDDIRTLKVRQSRPLVNSLWHAQIAALLARSQLVRTHKAQTEGATTTLRDWIPVTAATSATRGQGYPVAGWLLSDHKVVKRISHDEDFLYYRSPLRGNFEIECDLIDSTQVMIGGSYLGARPDRTALDIGTFRTPAIGEPVNPHFSPFWPSVHCRVVIREGTRSISVNGRPVKSDTLPENCDPWLAIRCAGRSQSGVQDFRITGHPQVVEIVRLSDSRELTGWIAYHDDPVLNESSGWTHVGDPESSGWIVGHPNPMVTGMSIESLLRYQRPLVEDGSIEYEFFYEPDAFQTHPALDRLAFILHPSGVKEHWIGDGRHDRTDVDPQNQIDIPLCRRGPADLPLVAREWNSVRLSLRGPTVTIALNGHLVYERELESTNLRTFGLFHFLGASAVRVRNAVMRGDWPKNVPSVAAQELADDETDQLDFARKGLTSEFSHDFRKEGVPDQYFKSPAPNPTLRMISVPQGVQASQRAAGPHMGFNIIPRFSLCGDFDIEARFTGLRIEGNGDAGIMLNATLEEELRHEYRALRMKATPGNHDLHASLSIVRPDGSRTFVGDSKSFEALQGRIRLARRGQRVFYLFAEDDSDHFFCFGSEPATDADTAIDGIFLHSFCNGVGISQVTWTNLILRAERIKWYAQEIPAPQEYLSVMRADGNGLRIIAAPKAMGFSSVRSPEWSPDHGRIVMEMSNGSSLTSHVFVVNADGAHLKNLGAGCMPSFSGDGTRIVCSVPGEGIVAMQSDGTAREVISAKGWGAQWSPDGIWIAFAEGDNIGLFDVKTRKSSKLLKGDAATRYRSVGIPGWSHDSRSIAFKGQRRDIDQEELSIVASGHESEIRVLYPNAHAVSADVTFSPDNQQLVVSIAGVASHQTRLYALNCTQPGPATPIFAAPLADHEVSGSAWSRDGKSIAITSHWSAPYIEWANRPITDKESR